MASTSDIPFRFSHHGQGVKSAGSPLHPNIDQKAPFFPPPPGVARLCRTYNLVLFKWNTQTTPPPPQIKDAKWRVFLFVRLQHWFWGLGGSVPCYSVRDCRLRNAECHEVSVAKIMEHSNSRTKCNNIICSGYLKKQLEFTANRFICTWSQLKMLRDVS